MLVLFGVDQGAGQAVVIGARRQRDRGHGPHHRGLHLSAEAVDQRRVGRRDAVDGPDLETVTGPDDDRAHRQHDQEPTQPGERARAAHSHERSQPFAQSPLPCQQQTDGQQRREQDGGELGELGEPEGQTDQQQPARARPVQVRDQRPRE